MKRFIILLIILFVAGSGCSYFHTKDEKNADELAGEGMKAFEKEKYKTAIEHFQKLKDWYPFSKFAILAELKIADAHFYLEEYEEAIAAYEEFEKLHPRNDAIPYVIYQEGLCYFKQIDTVDRDQSPAQKALDTFNRLSKQYPDNPYSVKSREHVSKCRESLANHELYVGMFYYRSKHFQAALSRFETILSLYPDVKLTEEVPLLVYRCKLELKKTEKEAKKPPG